MKIFPQCGGHAGSYLLILIALPSVHHGLLLRSGQSQSSGSRELNATSVVDYITRSAFAALSNDVQPAGRCSLMGGLVLPNVSARCCFSVQVATQRGLSQYGLAEPCKGSWRCEADGITPETGFEEQAKAEVCAQPSCLNGVTTAMKANWKTAKAAAYMTKLCDTGSVSVAQSTEAGLVRASLEGMERPAARRRKKTRGRNSKKKPPMCFPGEALVQILGRGAVPMASLQVGDQVLTAQAEAGSPLMYEAVLDWIHIAKGTEASFTTIRHEQGILRASPGHLVFVEAASGLHVDAPAGTLREGDVLLAATDSGLVRSKVLAVDQSSVSLGMYAPLTHSGLIIVDGVLASNYATPSLEVRLPHWLAHAGLFPVRAFHSLGLASIFKVVHAGLFGGDEELKGPEPDVVDIMHPYFSALYHGLHVQRLLPSA